MRNNFFLQFIILTQLRSKGKGREQLDDEQLLGHEMKHLGADDEAEQDGEQVSDWSTFWGESDPTEANEIRSTYVISFIP